MTKHTEPKTSFDYVTAKTRLDEILSLLQANDISIEDALKLHEEGMALVGQIDEYLRTAELSVRKLELGD